MLKTAKEIFYLAHRLNSMDITMQIDYKNEELYRIQFLNFSIKETVKNHLETTQKQIYDPFAKHVFIQLAEYFMGQRKSFDIPYKTQGTVFQEEVWKTLLQIPYGETCSYKDIAIKINKPKSYRAVGSVNNKNPLPILIPCHRVIAADGNLAGYAGQIPIKAALLNLEKTFLY